MPNIKKFSPENRNDKDYFDTTATEALLKLQEENTKNSTPKTNFIKDLDESDDQKEQTFLGGII